MALRLASPAPIYAQAHEQPNDTALPQQQAAAGTDTGARVLAHELGEHGAHARHDTEAPWWHRTQHWLIERLGGEHPHADEDVHEAHDETIWLTRYLDGLELFLKRPSLVAGEPAELLAHLTRLSDFTPVTEGRLLASLRPNTSGAETGEALSEVIAEAPSRPGLFRVRMLPTTTGDQRLRIELNSQGRTTTFDLGTVSVFADSDSAAETMPEAETHDGVALSKEQQWRSDFATALVERRRLRGSVPATGLLRPSADGEAHVTTPIDGHLRTVAAGAEARFPFTGMPVDAGQIMAYLVPQLGGEADIASLELAVTRADSVLNLARQERERLDALWQDRSIPFRDVLQARSAEEVAVAELTAVRRRLAQVQRTEEGEAAGVPVRAPIAGVVARVEVAPGGFVQEGARLFHIVDPRRLWLDAQVAEADIGRIIEPDGAWFRVPGFAPDPGRVFEVTPQAGARLMAFGALVDPASRTVPVIFEFPRPDERLRMGQAVTARVYTGEVQDGLAVPAGALVNDAGADVVYLQSDGEHFERRLVHTGIRDGAYVGIRDGLEAGERVVSRGAYLVHLAAGASAEAGHAHAH